MSRIYAEGPLLRYLTARARGFESEAEMLKLRAECQLQKEAQDNRRAATVALLNQFGLDENCNAK
jgi:hypothetical protein